MGYVSCQEHKSFPEVFPLKLNFHRISILRYVCHVLLEHHQLALQMQRKVERRQANYHSLVWHCRKFYCLESSLKSFASLLRQVLTVLATGGYSGLHRNACRIVTT